jgi:hypothetical protein
MPPRVLRTGPVPDYSKLREMRSQPGPIMGPLLRALADSLDPDMGGESFSGLARKIGVSHTVLTRLCQSPDTKPFANICEKIAEFYGLSLTGNHGRSSVSRPKTAAATGRKRRTSPQA